MHCINNFRLEEHANKQRDEIISTVHAAKKDQGDLNDAIGDLDKYKKSLRKSRDDARNGVKTQSSFLRQVFKYIAYFNRSIVSFKLQLFGFFSLKHKF